ncbi:hypothetical protein [Rhizobium sp. Leaf386]|uniref:hypothetical protein n=1 Tax=Rhizobium sp. Leaf386 TaxID=1736359 RepID=UPI0007134ABF|nr:hypothetical protein [Rhizobium sp. Leaf386]KQS84143.1 hypothetical protein ASG50_30105 [Rhizobium sp. Leaf386]
MARIRSLHDGFFTDDRLVTVSMAARMLFLGLGVHADDKGVFEWKPLTLKMRIFPADNLDVAGLLEELASIDAIRNYEIDGRRYGAIRNFRRFQRPKTPNDIHPIPDDFRNYVGLERPISEKRVGKQPAFPPNGEMAAQMEEVEEDVGEEVEEKKDNDVVVVASDDGSYAFSANTIRLTASDLAKWKIAFPHLGLEAELWGLDEWAGTKGAKWFVAVSGALAKKEREAVQRANAAKASRDAGGGARARRDGRI